MSYMTKACKGIAGTITVPGDKSISHRAVMIGAIADGMTEIENFLMSDDCLSTIDCFKKCGIDISVYEQKKVKVCGKGLKGLEKPQEILNVGNSGTTIRLLTGILSGQEFDCEITGDQSIVRRPMGRVTTPLRMMGALIDGDDGGNLAPLRIKGSKLNGIEYNMPVASAQVKSSILFASLYAEGETVIYESHHSRNHTEIMLNNFGANVKVYENRIISSPVKELFPGKVFVPGDISSAAFFIVAAMITPDSCITIKDVGVNPSRTGIIDVLQSMGGNICIQNQREKNGELVADITAYSSKLKGIEISGAIIPRLIDEIPIICTAAAFAEGTTIIRDAEELKFKESNRILSVANNLRLMGASVEETEDGLIINGGHDLKGNTLDSYNDHRIAMAGVIAGLGIKDGIIINNAECVSISFPDFFETIERVIKK